jgi:hypothetical protein
MRPFEVSLWKPSSYVVFNSFEFFDHKGLVFRIARHTFNESGVEIAIFDGNPRCYAEWAKRLA